MKRAWAPGLGRWRVGDWWRVMGMGGRWYSGWMVGRREQRKMRWTARAMLAMAGIMLCFWGRSYFIDDHLGQWRFRVLPGGGVIEHRHGIFSSKGRLALCNGTYTDSRRAIAETASNTRAEGETH